MLRSAFDGGGGGEGSPYAHVVLFSFIHQSSEVDLYSCGVSPAE